MPRIGAPKKMPVHGKFESDAGFIVADTPISHVTNGVHAPTWIAPLLRELLDRYLGEGWEQRQADPRTWEAVDRIPDEELWDVHCRLKRRSRNSGMVNTLLRR